MTETPRPPDDPPPPGENPQAAPPPEDPPYGPPPPTQGPTPYPAWSPPPPQRSAGLTVSAVFSGLGASVLAPLLGALVFNQLNGVIGLIGVPLIVLGVGIFLAVKIRTRRFGVPFLISFALSFIVLAGLCVGLITSMSRIG